MKLSEQLEQGHESGDFGRALAGYSERAKILEDAIIAMVDDGWLYCGSDDMSEAQKACYKAYQEINK